jgi:hypothetical protein
MDNRNDKSKSNENIRTIIKNLLILLLNNQVQLKDDQQQI